MPIVTKVAKRVGAAQTLAMVLFALLIPALVAGGAPISFTGWVLALSTLYSGVRLSNCLFGFGARPVRFFGWFFFYVVFGLAALDQYQRNTWPLPEAIDHQAMATAGVAILLFMIAYDIASSITVTHVNPMCEQPRLELAPERLIIIVPLAVISAIYEFRHLGGVDAVFVSRQNRALSTSSQTTASLAINTALLSSPLFVCAYVLILLRRSKAVIGWAVASALLVLASLALTNPISTARYGVATVYLSLVFARLWPLRVRHMVMVGLATFVGLFVVFPALNVFRTADSSPVNNSSIVRQLSTGDYDSFQQTVNSVSYSNAHGHAYGREELSAALFFVPRSLWPGKATDTGATVGSFMGYSFVNLSDPLPAEAYIDGGFPAVVIVGGLFGALSRRLEIAWVKGRGQIGYLAAIAPIFAVYQLILLRGSLLQAMGGIVAISLTLRLCFQRRRPGRDVDGLNAVNVARSPIAKSRVLHGSRFPDARRSPLAAGHTPAR